VLTPDEALAVAAKVLDKSRGESSRLERVRQYVAGEYPSQAYMPRKAKAEYLAILARSRVPVLSHVVDSLAQNLCVDGYRTPRASVDSPLWGHWQANRMDARQSGVHRSALTYGAAYVVIVDGSPVPTWRPVSARRMTAVYADAVGDEWPEFALEQWSEGSPQGPTVRFRLYDADAVYDLSGNALGSVGAVRGGAREHSAGVCPVVRFPNTLDLDGGSVGEVEPLIVLQDQLDAATFNVEMAQQYAVHRQRWVTGMIVEEDDDGNPVEPFKAAVDRVWQAEDPDTRFGEFAQTDTKAWLDARDATLHHIALKSQTPPSPHAMVNIAAEAMAAWEQPFQRKVAERKVTFGEAYEQCFALDARLSGMPEEADVAAEIVWRDTGSRSLSQTVDALGKAAQMLGIPPRGLWHRIPGVTDQELASWESMAAEADALGQLASMFERQLAEPAPVA
jgi:hypothetical protein